MNDQGYKVRGMALAVLAVGACVGLAGCGSAGGVKGSGGGPATMAHPSAEDFVITVNRANPAGTEIEFSKNQGDVLLDAVKTPGEGDNKIVWRSNESFSIQYVQVDDQTKQAKKIGDEKPGWNDADRQPAGSDYKYKLRLKVDSGSGNPKKTLRVAKYMVKSPAGCKEGEAGCFVLDPVLIVRY